MANISDTTVRIQAVGCAKKMVAYGFADSIYDAKEWLGPDEEE